MSQKKYYKSELTDFLTVDTLISLFYSDLNQRFDSHGERHDFWEFVYVDTGKLFIRTDQEEFILEKGEIYFHKPGEYHLHRAIPRTTSSICVIAFSSQQNILEKLAQKRFLLPEHCFHILSQIMKYGSMVFSSLVDTREHLYLVKNDSYPPYAEQIVRNYLEIFLMEMIALVDLPRSSKPKLPANVLVQNQTKEFVRMAEEYLTNNLFSKITIPELCRHLNCSKTTLSTAFKNCTGMSIIQYFNYLKIEKAKELIRLNSLNLTQISELLNFCNISYFSNSFKQQTGMHPSEYAKSIKAADCIRYLHSERGQDS